MIILRLLFTLFMIFLLLMLVLGISLWVKVRMHLQNPFLRPRDNASRDDNVIEGEYKVLDESHKD